MSGFSLLVVREGVWEERTLQVSSEHKTEPATYRVEERKGGSGQTK